MVTVLCQYLWDQRQTWCGCGRSRSLKGRRGKETLYLGVTDLNLEHLVHFNNKVKSTYQIDSPNVLKHVQAGLSTWVSFQMCVHCLQIRLLN